jgi:hypothetical protein
MQTKFEQLLDLLINEDNEKANELFHEIVVEKSRDIYESLIADEAVEEGKDDEDKKTDEEIEEELDESESVIEIGGEDHNEDETDDFLSDVEVDSGEDEDDFSDDEEELSDEEQTDRILDLENALDELKAEFEALLGDEQNEPEHNDGMEDPDFGAMDDMDDENKPQENYMGESAQLSKVPPVKHGDNGQNTKSIVAKPNNMGGTAENILRTADEKGGKAAKPKDMNTGNINVATGSAKAGDAFKKHAVPKTTDSASNKQSVLAKSHNK